MGGAISSQKYVEMGTRYEGLTGQPWGFYASCRIDAGWILAQAVLETQRSITPKIIGTEIAKVLPDICYRYFGYSGWCLLNEAGDRVPVNYDIWGYGMVGDVPSHVKYGYYDCMADQVVWYPIP